MFPVIAPRGGWGLGLPFSAEMPLQVWVSQGVESIICFGKIMQPLLSSGASRGRFQGTQVVDVSSLAELAFVSVFNRLA